MRIPMFLAFGLLAGSTGALSAQSNPKIDSLRLVLPAGRDSVSQLLAAAFMRAGLPITNATGFFVESDQGTTGSSAMAGVTKRIVRAGFATLGDSTIIVLTGDEVRFNSYGDIAKRLRIDNKAGGNGEKVWCKMVAVAKALDSLQVPAAAKMWLCAKQYPAPGAGGLL